MNDVINCTIKRVSGGLHEAALVGLILLLLLLSLSVHLLSVLLLFLLLLSVEARLPILEKVKC